MGHVPFCSKEFVILGCLGEQIRCFSMAFTMSFQAHYIHISNQLALLPPSSISSIQALFSLCFFAYKVLLTWGGKTSSHTYIHTYTISVHWMWSRAWFKKISEINE